MQKSNLPDPFLSLDLQTDKVGVYNSSRMNLGLCKSELWLIGLKKKAVQPSCGGIGCEPYYKPFHPPRKLWKLHLPRQLLVPSQTSWMPKMGTDNYWRARKNMMVFTNLPQPFNQKQYIFKCWHFEPWFSLARLLWASHQHTPTALLWNACGWYGNVCLKRKPIDPFHTGCCSYRINYRPNPSSCYNYDYHFRVHLRISESYLQFCSVLR